MTIMMTTTMTLYQCRKVGFVVVADTEENANKLHFIFSNFVIHPRILIFSVFKIASFPHADYK